jgi:phosphogluconate dehydratase
MGFLIRELLDAGLMHSNVSTVCGEGLRSHAQEPWLSPTGLAWREPPQLSGDPSVLRPAHDPFSHDGGLKLLRGNLGRAVIKTSAVADAHRVVEAPARIFNDQEEVLKAFRAKQLECDAVVVVRYQGPAANGMPELHQLTPALASLQDRGFHVALVTDGRMSGASGNVPAAIHITPEAVRGGPLARLRDGDVIRLDSRTGILEAKVTEATLQARAIEAVDLSGNDHGMGRELFRLFRSHAAGAEQGAGVAV